MQNPITRLLPVLVCLLLFLDTGYAQKEVDNTINRPLTLRLGLDAMFLNTSVNYHFGDQIYSELGVKSFPHAFSESYRCYTQLKYGLTQPGSYYFVKVGLEYSYGNYFNSVNWWYDILFNLELNPVESELFHAVSPVVDLHAGIFYVSYSPIILKWNEGFSVKAPEALFPGEMKVGLEFDPVGAYYGFVQYIKSF